SSVAAATAMLTASVVRPTPPFGLNTATTCPGSPVGGKLVPPSPRLAPRSGGGARAGAAFAAARLGRDDRHARHLLAFPGEDLADRRSELVAAERLDEEFAGSGQHRATEVVGLALHGHHDHGGGGDGSRHLLCRRDAVHIRH